MSQQVGGTQFLNSGSSHSWTATWDDSGWQGNTTIQPEPFNTGSSMTVSGQSVSLNGSGQYAFGFTITNNGPNSTNFNLQIAND
jgi:hypothetical protein